MVAPNTKGDLSQALSKSSARKSEDNLSLMMAYRDAHTKSVKLQILSLYAHRFSNEKLTMNHMSTSRAGKLNKPGNMLQIKDLESHRKKQSNVAFTLQWLRSIIS